MVSRETLDEHVNRSLPVLEEGEVVTLQVRLPCYKTEQLTDALPKLRQDRSRPHVDTRLSDPVVVS
jgi:hypothetical protein